MIIHTIFKLSKLNGTCFKAKLTSEITFLASLNSICCNSKSDKSIQRHRLFYLKNHTSKTTLFDAYHMTRKPVVKILFEDNEATWKITKMCINNTCKMMLQC